MSILKAPEFGTIEDLTDNDFNKYLKDKVIEKVEYDEYATGYIVFYLKDGTYIRFSTLGGIDLEEKGRWRP